MPFKEPSGVCRAAVHYLYKPMVVVQACCALAKPKNAAQTLQAALYHCSCLPFADCTRGRQPRICVLLHLAFASL